jgi:hypothetical protein
MRAIALAEALRVQKNAGGGWNVLDTESGEISNPVPFPSFVAANDFRVLVLFSKLNFAAAVEEFLEGEDGELLRIAA